MYEISEKLIMCNFEKQLNKLSKKYQNKKIVLYGAGSFFDIIINNYNLSKLNIIAICDKKFESTDSPESYAGYKTIAPEQIHTLKPDIVFLTLENEYYIEKYFHENLFKKNGKKFKYKPILALSLSIKIQEEWEFPFLF